MDLKTVQFGTGQCGVIQTTMAVPRLQNANGGDIYIYPGFVVYHASATNYALIELSDIALKVDRLQFQKMSASLPSDAKQVGTAWAKANKDGSPDKRFKDNYSIPVMQYAPTVVEVGSRPHEEYVLSNVEAASNSRRLGKPCRPQYEAEPD